MFSVVIPLFNKKDYIARAVNSVIGQRCHPAEIIIIDDGSTDGGGDLVKQNFGDKVIVIRQDNHGVSAARNRGMQVARNAYVAFLDADDEWSSLYLERMGELIQDYPGAGIYGSGFQVCYDGSIEKTYSVRPGELLNNQLHRLTLSGPVDYFKALMKEDVLCSSSIVVDKCKAFDVDGFPEGIAICEDYEFWIKMALKYQVVLISEPLAIYHTDASGTARKYWQETYKNNFPVLPIHRFLVDNYRQHALLNPSFKRYCRKQIRICLLQRIYNRRFDAAARFYDQLELQGMNMGWRIKTLGKVAELLCRP